MPRNDQITRQWHLLRRLEGTGGQTRWRLMEGFRDVPALGFSATEPDDQAVESRPDENDIEGRG